MICQLAKDGLAYFKCSRPTIAMTDRSKEGIGFVVLQKYCSCASSDAPFCCRNGWRLALCGSRHLTSAEAGYAPVEGEALVVAWCLRKARLFLLGCPNLVLITDHRPLVKLFGDRELKDIVNPRLFALKEKTLLYRFQVTPPCGPPPTPLMRTWLTRTRWRSYQPWTRLHRRST